MIFRIFTGTRCVPREFCFVTLAGFGTPAFALSLMSAFFPRCLPKNYATSYKIVHSYMAGRGSVC